jgi:hypothetical protein
MKWSSPAISEEWNITSWKPKDGFLSEEFFVPMCSTGCTVPYFHGIRYTETVAHLCVQIHFIYSVNLNNQIQKISFLQVNM